MSEECRQLEITYGHEEAYINPEHVHFAETDECPVHRISMERLLQSEVMTDMRVYYCRKCCNCYYVHE